MSVNGRWLSRCVRVHELVAVPGACASARQKNYNLPARLATSTSCVQTQVQKDQTLQVLVKLALLRHMASTSVGCLLTVRFGEGLGWSAFRWHQNELWWSQTTVRQPMTMHEREPRFTREHTACVYNGNRELTHEVLHLIRSHLLRCSGRAYC